MVTDKYDRMTEKSCLSAVFSHIYSDLRLVDFRNMMFKLMLFWCECIYVCLCVSVCMECIRLN